MDAGRDNDAGRFPWAAAWLGLALSVAAAAAAVNGIFGDFPVFIVRSLDPLLVIPSGLLAETVLLAALSLLAGALLESVRRLIRAPPSLHTGALWTATLLFWLYAARAAVFMGIRRGLGRSFPPPEVSDRAIVWIVAAAAALSGAAIGFFWRKRPAEFLVRSALAASLFAAFSAGGYSLVFQRWREARSYPLPAVLPHLAALAAVLAVAYLSCRAGGGLRRLRRVSVLVLAASAVILTAYYSYPAPSRPPSIAAAVVDALRADRLSCYRYPEETSPFLDRLAPAAVQFENAYSVSNYTYPSHVTFFTGQEYRAHGYQIGDWKDWKRYQGERTLPEELRERGYHTVLFTENPWVLAVDKGFDEVRWFDWPKSYWGPEPDHCEFGGPPPLRNFAEPFFGRHLLDWIASLRGGYYPLWTDAFQERAVRKLVVASRRRGPVFLFLNWMTVHERTHPDATWAPDREYRGYDFSSEYDRSVRHADRRLENLYSIFGGGSGGCLIVTSDHGELLGEYGLIGHNKTLFEEVLRVPLLVAGGGLSPAAVTETASLNSFHRLVLALASGKATTEAVRKICAGEGVAFAEHGYLREGAAEFDWCYTVIEPRVQYIFYPAVLEPPGSWPRGKTEALFLAGGPRGPGDDRAAAEPSLAAALKERYQKRLRALSVSRSSVPSDPASRNRQEETLRSLGYLQ